MRYLLQSAGVGDGPFQGYHVEVMASVVEQIESSLAIVQRTLDQLTSRGHDEAAFDLAKAQYSASIRSSWPGNLGILSHHLMRVAEDTTHHFGPAERHEIAEAARTLRDLCNQ